MISFKSIVLLAIATTSLIANYSFAANKMHGQQLVEQKNCASCHGQDFNTTIMPDYPKLAGQKQDYLYYALLSYKSSDPNFSRTNPIMTIQVKDLSLQDMKDIAAYLSSLSSSLVMKK